MWNEIGSGLVPAGSDTDPFSGRSVIYCPGRGDGLENRLRGISVMINEYLRNDDGNRTFI